MISEFKAVRICIVDPLHSNTILFSPLNIMVKSEERLSNVYVERIYNEFGGASDLPGSECLFLGPHTWSHQEAVIIK